MSQHISKFTSETANACFGRALRTLASITGIVLLLAGCTSKVDRPVVQKSQPKIPLIYPAEVGKKPPIISEQALFALSPEQQQNFQRFLNHPSNRDIVAHEKVAKYLNRSIKGFNYHSKTYTASQAASLNAGNCLSLAILTTALAQVANINVEYELMHTPPVYQRKGETVISSQHVRSLLFQPTIRQKEGYTFWLQPVIKIDYFPTEGGHVRRRVFQPEFVSMYFRNKAAESLVEGDYRSAFWYAHESLDYAPNNAHATNMIALVYDKLGYSQAAESVFLFGIDWAKEKLELYSNYHKFLLRQNRIDEAQTLQAAITEINEPDPFDWLDLGDEAIAEGNLTQAGKYFDKVIELAPYLHHGYSGKGRVEYLKGNKIKAKKAFNKAAELAYEKETKAMYRAKLSAIVAGYDRQGKKEFN